MDRDSGAKTDPTLPKNSLRPSSRLRSGRPSRTAICCLAMRFISAMRMPCGQTREHTPQAEQ